MAKSKVGCKPVNVEKLTKTDISQMYSLFEKYYECISYEMFQKDLKKKDKVLIMRELRTRLIVGFTTVKMMTFNIEKNGKTKQVKGLFSGDTIVAKEYWGQKLLHGTFANMLIKEKLKRPFTDFYWCLISKGYKTYLLLTNNFVDYYPRHDQQTPGHVQSVIDSYAMELYPEAYCHKSGLLRFEESLGQLKATVAPIDTKLIETHPNVAFFQNKNPEWQKGHELVCLGVINWALFGYYFRRSLKFTLGRRKEELKTLQPQTEVS
ncbi:MAG: hypothetical protein AB7H97_12580 [Pseudobdellovibrionaceae bacterium]